MLFLNWKIGYISGSFKGCVGVNKIFAYMKRKQKGQGIVEYALILAFVVGIAMVLQGVGLKNSIVAVFDNVVDTLGGYKTYADYYGDWHRLSYNDLSAKPNEDRIKADQEGLQLLVQNLIGLNQEDALTELKKLMGTVATKDNVYPDGNGDSKVLTLLGTWDHYYDTPNAPYITLDRETQKAAVGYLTNQQAEIYKDNNRTKSKDRVFFSEDMINSTGVRTVTAQLHYENGQVSSVDVISHIGNASSTTYAEGLNITVTGSGKGGYTVK